MITVSFPDVGVLGEFEVPTSQPNYWQERLSYYLLSLLEAISDAPLEIKQLEIGDIQGQVDALNAVIQDAYSDIDSLYGGGD